jgi:hypothetical protein
MRTNKTLRWVLVATGTSLLAASLAWAEMRECVDCYPCGSSGSGGTIMCCITSAC